MTKQEIYNSKLKSVDAALDAVQSGYNITTGIYGCEPVLFMSNLYKVADRVTGVKLWCGITHHDYEIMTDNSYRGKIDFLTLFYNKHARAGHAESRFDIYPSNLHSGAITKNESACPNIFVAAVSPMDDDGNFCLACDVQSTVEGLEASDIVVFEVNKNLPRVYGDTFIPVEKADIIYEVDYPISNAPIPQATPEELKIAEYVSSLIKDGDCIQLGIGGMPNAVGKALMDKKDLGIHTEMLTGSMGALIRAGVVTNERKNINRGVTVAAFAWGDDELYKLMDNNKSILLQKAAITNDPFVIAQNDNVVSVNTALEIDLTGQICSESIGHRQYSGTGGASDFAYGAFHSRGGRGIVALTSTAKGGQMSKIKALLTPGAVVSISRNIADYIVTEYGIAKLKYKSIRERAQELINIAHPDFRDELKRDVDKYMIW